MQAVYCDRYGGPEVLQYGELPDPVAGPGEVVVEIYAASVNGADWKVRAGDYGAGKFPQGLGRDFSGVVVVAGEGTTEFAIGSPVFGVLDAGQEGAYAEKIAIRSAIVAPKPADMPHEVAAALALTGLTALVSIEDTLELKRGETILIQGGAGGVASFAIQLAKHIGARVITTTSAGNVSYVRDLGADEVIDYKKQNFAEFVSNCDAVFDTVGGDVAQQSFSVLKPGGRAAFIASGGQAPKPSRDDVRALRPKVGRDRAHLERIAALYQSKVIRAPQVTTFRLADAVEAHRISQARHLRGKLVFEVR